jgi:two-component system NtrC family sensor kinase
LISGHVQLLEVDLARSPRDGQARLKIIGEQIERIERIVRSMLDRTRFETELAPVNLNQVLQHLLDAAAPAFDKRKVKLVENLDPSLPMIGGASDRLQQLFLNLLNNSLDAMPRGGELTVSTQVAVDQSGLPLEVIVEFADDGLGMVPETLAHIFDPLYTTKAPGQGTGLGLVIVSQIVREHGGDVEVQSNAGEGTKFRLTFPPWKGGPTTRNEEPALDTVHYENGVVAQ